MGGYRRVVEPIVEGALSSPDGYWLVEAIRYGRTERWFRIRHATTIVADRASLATVQRVLGDAYATLMPADDIEGPATATR